ncbi:MAG: pyridoxal 5'-phosphate synthase glutaminase subunit PdxT [bacterium]|nr:pyridoxal 5'-phosphate synthase glutaminase subunit PdxT [bacterium]
MSIGVLALQGDFEKHANQVISLGAAVRLVKLPDDLNSIDALILPGGESTTMSILMDKHHLRQPLKDFARNHPLYGTCAGMILLANSIQDNQSGVAPLQLMDIDVLRNGYGRQLFSFEEEITAELAGTTEKLRGTFIRAPRIVRCGKDVTVLARYQNDPVLVRQGMLLAGSFHNELGSEATVLRYFLDDFFGDNR